MVGVNSLPKTVTRQHHDCDLNAGPTAPESSTLTTRLQCNQLMLLLQPFSGHFSRTVWVSWYQKGKTSLGLNEARDNGVLRRQWHQLDHMQTICTLLQTDNHTSTSSLNVYRLDALPDAQPRVSKLHWRQQVMQVNYKIPVHLYTDFFNPRSPPTAWTTLEMHT